MKKVIIFDTNAYRVLTSGHTLDQARTAAARMRELEIKGDVLVLAHPFVIWELVGHLADVADPAYARCLHAVVALAEHAWSRTDPSAGLSVFADPESTVCRELFRLTPPDAATNVQNLCKLAAHLKDHAAALTLPSAIHNLKVFANALREREAKWLNDMKSVVTSCDPKVAQAWIGGSTEKEARRKLIDYFRSSDFMNAWSVVMAIQHAAYVGVTLRGSQLREKAQTLRRVFPVPFHLMAVVLEKFPAQQIKLEGGGKRWENYLWDMSLCYSIGDDHAIDDAPIYFVTGDKAIKAAATTARCGQRVMNLADYLAEIKYP